MVKVLAEFTTELIAGMSQKYYEKAKQLANNDNTR